MSLIKQNTKIVKKIWGYEIWYCNFKDLYCGKMLVLKPGFQMSLHKHLVKHETFLVLEGTIVLTSSEDNFRIEDIWVKGSVVTIEPKTFHSMRALNGEAKLIEFSTHHSNGDVKRLTESHRIQEEETK